MALVERLMRLEEPKIPVHSFFAAVQRWKDGAMTDKAIESGFSLTVAEKVELDALLAKSPLVDVLGKEEFVSRIHAVFILAEDRFPGYTTAAEIRAALGI